MKDSWREMVQLVLIVFHTVSERFGSRLYCSIYVFSFPTLLIFLSIRLSSSFYSPFSFSSVRQRVSSTRVSQTVIGDFYRSPLASVFSTRGNPFTDIVLVASAVGM